MAYSSGFPAGKQADPVRRCACAYIGLRLPILRLPILCLALLGLTLPALAGCASAQYVRVRSVPKSPLVEQLKLTSSGGPHPSERTMQVLRRFDLARDLNDDWKALLGKFQTIVDRQPSAELLYSYAELSFLAGKRQEAKNPAQALDHYGGSVSYAYLYLFDERFGATRNPYDPQYRGACDVYNGALEGALRIVRKQGALVPGCMHTIQTASQEWDVTVVTRGGCWRSSEIDHFEFVSDYEIQGLTNQYQSFGLGVPLIAVRKRSGNQEVEGHYPPNLSVPVTAFLRLVPDNNRAQPGQPCRHAALLELCDPLDSTDIEVCQRTVPLESDLSTPLAYFLNDPVLNELASPTSGLLHPEQRERVAGLYMAEPYAPGKMPVVMVHGLWSNPLTWMEMFNDLRSDPEIRERFQFWFYLYPTGKPFWESATRFRTDLAQMRATLDPARREPALDQMVLVGHSMGGLISKLQIVDSGNDFWQIVSDKPFQLVKASPEDRQRLEQTFYFGPNPGIRRLITIGTPHRGSKFANYTTRFVAQKLISLPQMPLTGRQQLFRDNPGVFRDSSLVEVKTSIDSLAPDSPILPVLLEAKRPPWVKVHNIVGALSDEGFLGRFVVGTDGVVSYESAHLEDADSELVVNADHSMVHRHPLTVLEVRRILLEHAAEMTLPRIMHDRTARGGGRPAPAGWPIIQHSNRRGFPPAAETRAPSAPMSAAGSG